jgi:hypothetical protein
VAVHDEDAAQIVQLDPAPKGKPESEPLSTVAMAEGVRMAAAPLPPCLDYVWAERDGIRWLIVRDTLTMQQARRQVATVLLGDPERRMATTAQDPRHPGATLGVAGGALPPCTDLVEVERDKRQRLLVVNESLTVADAQRIVAAHLANLPRPKFRTSTATA